MPPSKVEATKEHRPGEQVLADDAAKKILAEVQLQSPGTRSGPNASPSENHAQHQLQAKLTLENNRLHRSGTLPGLNIVGYDSNKHLIVADTKKGAGHRAYTVGEDGRIVATYKVIVGPAGSKRFEKLESQTPPGLGGQAEAKVETDKDHKSQEQQPTETGTKEGDGKKVDAPRGLRSQANGVENRRGVRIEQHNGRFAYYFAANGQESVLFTTEATESGLREGDEKLSKLVEDKQNELTSQFKVTFGRSGEDVVWKANPAEQGGGHHIKARTPRLDELAGVEAALFRSQPAQLLDNSGLEGIKVNFLTETSIGSAAYKSAGLDGKSAIFVEPRSVDTPRFPTEQDGAKAGGTARESTEALFVHELSHNTQHKTGWDELEKRKQLVAEIGWIPSTTDSQLYLFRDKEGHLYRPPNNEFDTPLWTRCNEAGEPINDKGEVVTPDKAIVLSNDQMMAIAEVPPASGYFPNATEMCAGGLTFFRLDRKWREDLLNRSPRLYKLAKQLDQAEIDATYGTGKYIRSLDGLLVEDTYTKRKSIESLERGRIT
ncbi:MAG: hypothetical protein HY711_01915 [Candidatus Melainabacteria bacterium]|nr:hypothetical protein [Candidatus Melainabacteria bacterium]